MFGQCVLINYYDIYILDVTISFCIHPHIFVIEHSCVLLVLWFFLERNLNELHVTTGREKRFWWTGIEMGVFIFVYKYEYPCIAGLNRGPAPSTHGSC